MAGCIFCVYPILPGQMCVKFAFWVGEEWANKVHEIHAACNPNRKLDGYSPSGEYVKEQDMSDHCCGKCDANQREKHPGGQKARKQRDMERGRGDVKALRKADEEAIRRREREMGYDEEE